jgi:hypothetical protein
LLEDPEDDEGGGAESDANMSFDLPASVSALLDGPLIDANQLFRKCKHPCSGSNDCGHKCCLLGVGNGKDKVKPKPKPKPQESTTASSVASSSGSAAASDPSATESDAPSQQKPSTIVQYQQDLSGQTSVGRSNFKARRSFYAHRFGSRMQLDPMIAGWKKHAYDQTAFISCIHSLLLPLPLVA